jgi:hypothetical protein
MRQRGAHRPGNGRNDGKIGTVLLVILGILVALGVGGYFVMKWGFNFVAEDVKADIQDHPAILEHIGAIEEIEFDFGATTALKGEANNVYVFQLKGGKGKGTLTATVETDGDHERVVAGKLRLPSGETVDLFPDGPPDR